MVKFFLVDFHFFNDSLSDFVVLLFFQKILLVTFYICLLFNAVFKHHFSIFKTGLHGLFIFPYCQVIMSHVCSNMFLVIFFQLAHEFLMC